MNIDIFDFVALYPLILICEILVLFVVIKMVAEKQKPTSMIAWLLAIIFLPYIAVPCYFIFGIRKHPKRNQKSTFNLQEIEQCETSSSHPIRRILTSQNIPKPTINNNFELYKDGITSYEALVRYIQSAQHSIYISTYVFQKDSMTKRLLELLTQKAKQGVTVKLLIDSLGSYRVYFNQKIFLPLRQAGGQVCFFMPIIQMPFRNYVNYRNHRKIYLFDNHQALTGGMNLGNEYMGPTTCEKRWDDLLYKIEGDAICHFHNLFATDWEYASKEHIDVIAEVPSIEHYGHNLLQVVPSGPDMPHDALYQSILMGIYAAQSRIWIITPYFVPSDALMEALQIAHYRGVDVKLITPKKSNHLIADLARSHFMRQLTHTGIEVALFDKKMLHAKAILFDTETVMLGSVNLDNRSLFLNYEVVTYAYEQKIIQEIDSWMRQFLKNADYQLPTPGKMRKLAENMVKLLVPLL